MILPVLFGISFGWFMTNVFEWHRKIVPNIKPFNCCPCLSAWSGLIAYFIPEFLLIPMAVLFMSGTIGAILQKATL
jgi:hypothetical protein